MAIFTTHSVNQKQFVPEYGNLFILLGCTPNQHCLLKADIQNMIRIKSSEKRDSIFQPEFPRLRIKSNECLISLKCVIRTYEIYISFIFQTSIQCNNIIYICATFYPIYVWLQENANDNSFNNHLRHTFQDQILNNISYANGKTGFCKCKLNL